MSKRKLYTIDDEKKTLVITSDLPAVECNIDFVEPGQENQLTTYKEGELNIPPSLDYLIPGLYNPIKHRLEKKQQLDNEMLIAYNNFLTSSKCKQLKESQENSNTQKLYNQEDQSSQQEQVVRVLSEMKQMKKMD